MNIQEILKGILGFCLGSLLVITLIPPMLIITAAWIAWGSDRELADVDHF